jgi:hypothetical protein
MSAHLNKWFVITFASAIALGLFSIGTSYPLDVRVRGDALGYLKIADSFSDFASAFGYVGERTAGLPILEYAVHQALSVFSPTVYLLAWINVIGLVMLATHVLASWLFSAWAQGTGLIASKTCGYLLFVYLATFPALVGHTTSPLSDTLSLDLILLGLVSLGSALNAKCLHTCLQFSGLAAACLGFSVLVRPASLIGLGIALLVCGVISLWGPRFGRITLGAVLLGCLVFLAPGALNCTEKYGSVCLQSPKTFNANLSMQDGLRGARLMWSQNNEFPGTLPIVKDETMFNHYFRLCQIDSTIGFGDTSLTGCLMAKPLTLPAFVAKKWIGLFDYFRFTPYLENLTPAWLRNLSRVYGALAWLGLSLCFVTLLKLRHNGVRARSPQQAGGNMGLVFLAVYSLVMLAQHTALHTEERYGFPLIPLCAAVLFGHCERTIERYRSGERRSLMPLLLFCCLSLLLFAVQVVTWDRASFALPN